MAAYVELTDLQGMIPDLFLTQALDDDGDNQPDAWTTVQSQACDAVDALLCGRYSTPFAAPFPTIVAVAARTFAAEACYQRRGRIEDQNPFSEAAGRYRAQLSRIAKGDIPLTPSVDPVTTEEPAAIATTARSVSRAGRLIV